MEFSANKCHVLDMKNEKKRLKYKLGNKQTDKVKEERDLRVIIEDNQQQESIQYKYYHIKEF